MTITASRSLVKLKSNGHSNEYAHHPHLYACISDAMHRNLHLLALSTRITELSYTISDIQTRIFGQLGDALRGRYSLIRV